MPSWLRRRRAPAEAEERDLFAQSSQIPPWWAVSGGWTTSGAPVTTETAVGLPAFGAGVRLLAEMVAQLPLNVYRGRGENKLLADQTWQYRLLAEMPGMGDFTPFDLVSDIVGSLECSGNAYLQKVKADGEVVALIVVNPSRVRVVREQGEKVFYVRDATSGHETKYTGSTILHIRGFTPDGSDVGLSPIFLHRQKLGEVLAQQEFQSRFYSQGAATDIAVTMNKRMTPDQEEAFFKNWQAHRGLRNAHLPLVVYGEQAELQRIGMSLRDAQFIEAEQLNLTQVAHILRLPPKFLTIPEGSRGGLVEWDFIALYSLSLAPRLKRIEAALFMDADLFPQRLIYPEFDTRPLLRTDAKTKAEVEHLEIQDGSRLVDEVRADRGDPPLPAIPGDPSKTPGKVPQVTPVGGAPNNTQPPQPAEKVAAGDG